MGDNKSLTNEDIIHSLKNRGDLFLKTLYDDYSPKLLGIISMIVADEEMRLEILKKTFVRICLDIKSYDPMHSTLLIWMIKITISVSAECMNISPREIQNKFRDAYRALKTNN